MTFPRLQHLLSPLSLLATVAGSAVATSYVLQPLLPQVVKSFPSPSTVTLVAGASPAGYMLGLLFIVPLSLSGKTKYFLVFQICGLSAALLAGSLSISATMLASTTLFAGAAATIAAQAVSVAVRMNPDRPGHAVGIVAMGTSVGSLLGRVVGGFLGELLGWRLTLLTFAGALLVCAVLLQWLINVPASAETKSRFFDLARKLPSEFRDNARLRKANIIGWCYYSPFSALWSALALHLASPPLKYGAGVAGAFGILGIAGALVVRLSGPATDRFGAKRIISTSLTIGLIGLLILYELPLYIPALILGVLLVDAAAFSAHTANQTSILSNNENRDSQTFALFTLIHSTAGIAGAALGPTLFQLGGWNLVSFSGASLFVIGLAVTTISRISPTVGSGVARDS